MLATWSGDIPNGTVWTNSEVQRITGNITIPAGSTLTIQPGTVVKFNAFQALNIKVDGTLAAQGTAGQPIVFTTLTDDTVGGDTNGDGSNSTAYGGQWDAIQFTGTSTGNVLDRVEVRFGGSTSAGQVFVNGGPLTLTNSMLQNSATAGVRIVGSNPTLTNTTFKNNIIAASMDLASNPAISGVTMTTNGVNALRVDGGTLPIDGNWNDPDITYVVQDAVTVPAGRTLNVAAGQIVKFREFGNFGMTVNGTLKANGTAVAPVIFTTTRDDTAGGDAHNDGAGNTAYAGQWDALVFNATSTGNVLDRVEVRYGGSSSAGQVVINGAPLALTNSRLFDSFSAGIRMVGASPTLTDVVYHENGIAASMDLASSPAISGVTMTANNVNALRVDGGSLPVDANWNDPDITYLIQDAVTVPVSRTLEIGAGQIIKFREFANFGMTVNGTLKANGTAGAPVIFTTTRDDAAEGDAYNDGPGNAAYAGQWDALTFNATSVSNVLDRVEVRYGGSSSTAQVVVNGGPLTLTNSTLFDSFSAGIRMVGASPTLTNVVFKDNGIAASMDLGSSPAINGVTMTTNNVNALRVDGGTLPADGTWDDPAITYLVQDAVIVPEGKTLTIAAGQVVKFREFGNFGITVNGTLKANGSPQAPTIFTSTRDDAAGGDAYNDGTGNTPYAGQWDALKFSSTSTGNALDHVQVRYGGSASGAQILVNGGPLALTNSTLQTSASAGIRIQNSNPTLASIVFQDNVIAASMDLASNPTIAGVTMANNNVNALRVDGGTLLTDATWNDPAITYLVQDAVTVPAGKSLSIAAGQVVKFREFGNFGITVDGALQALGSPGLPVIFTTTRDDSAGGDAYNDGTGNTPYAGQWGALVFNSTSAGNVLTHVEARYGGSSVGTIVVDGAPLTLTNSKLQSSATAGVRIQNSNPTLTNLTFQNNFVAASMDLGSNPAISGVTMIGNGTNALALDAGELTVNGVWNDPEITYLLNGSVTVPADKTLSIAAGQIVKLREFAGVSLLVNGSLAANGSPAAPITFTSSRDDSVGGDTFNNGQTSLGVGQWNSVRFNAGSTANVLNHVEARYGGGSTGMIVVDGGLTLTSSKLHTSATPAIRVLNSGTATVTSNLLFRNSDTGISAESGARVVATNNTIDGNFRGVIADGVTTILTLNNNLITNNTRSGVFRGNSATINTSFNDVFNPAANGGNYEGLTDQTGQNNNTSVDPKYFNRAAAQFQLRAGSSAIDSATSAGAPLTDFFGNSRFDDPNIFNTGVGSIPFVDRGAIERQEISTSDIDLFTVAVTAPITGMQDETVTVNWTVQNVGVGTAAGPWKDAVYMSVDPVWTPDDQLLAEKNHASDLGAGLTYSDSTSVTLPGALPGSYYFIVRTDSRNDAFEALAEVNNAGATSQTISLELPSLFFGTPTTAQLPAAGTSKFFKVALPAGADLSVDLTGPTSTPSTNSYELYLKFGELPSRQSFDERGNRPNQASQTVTAADTRAGNYYVQVYGAAVPTPQALTLTATLTGFSIKSVSPAKGSNLGQVTVAIAGAQFDANSQVRLIDSAGGTINPLNVSYIDTGLVSATFDLTGRAIGLADVQVVNTGNVVTTLPDSFNITSGQVGRLSTTISAPSRVRLGRDFAVTIHYRNTGDTDLIAPIIRAIGNGVTQLSLAPDLAHLDSAVELIAVNPQGAAGVLSPGASGQIQLYGRSASVGDDVLKVEVATFPSTPIDWNAIEPVIRPADLPAAEWTALFTQLKTQIGDAWSQYVASLSESATLLADPRSLNYSLRDVFQIEVEDATAALNTSVSGRLFLRDTAHPLAGGRLNLIHQDTGDAFVTSSRTDGTFVFPKVAAGIYRITVEGYAVSGQPLLTVNTADVAGLNVVATTAGAISGGVVRAVGGAPLANILVRAISATGEIFGVQTLGDGTYRIEGFPAGTYDLFAGDGQFSETARRGLVVAQGAEIAHVNLVVGTAATVSGRITGAGGAPFNGAVVLAYDIQGLAVGDAVVTDATGDYTLRGLPVGTFTIQATAEDFSPAILRNVVTTPGAALTGRDLQLLLAGTIQGTVTKQSGGAAIPFGVLSAKKGAELVQVTQANDDGSFEFLDLPPGNYTITAAVRGFREATASAVVIADQVTTLPAITLASTGGISGSVLRQSDSAPLAGVAITVFSNGIEVAFAQADSAGGYSISDLAPGTYLVVVGSLSSAGVAGTTVTISDATPEATANFAVPVIGSIAGVVYAAEGTTPLADARVSLYAGGQPVATLFSDDAGIFKFHVLAAGSYSLLAAANGIGFAPRNGLALSTGTNLAGMNLVAGNAKLEGVVTDQVSSQPLAGATLHLRGDGIDGIIDVTTDSAGHYEFSGASGAQLQIVAEASGHAFGVLNTTLAAAGAVTLNFALSEGRAFVGAVRDAATGLPLSRATIAVRNIGGPADGFTAVTDEQGRYRIGTLPSGTYDLTAVAGGHQTIIARGLVLGASDQARDFNLGNSNIEVRGTVTDAQGRGLPGVAVEAVDADGNVVGIATTASDGSYVLSTLPAGTFVILATTDGAASATSTSFTVAAGDNRTGVNVALAPLAIGVDTSFVPGFPESPANIQSLALATVQTQATGIIAGALNLFKHLPRPRRLNEETFLPTLPSKTCAFVITRHRELAAYISLREKMFQVWQENYETGREVKSINQAVVGLDVLKLAGTTASLTLNAAKVLKNLKYIKIPDPTVGTEVLNAVKGLVDRYDKYFFKFQQLIIGYSNAVASGQKPPDIKDTLLTIAKGVKQVFDDIVTFVGDKESIWGKASPVVGTVFGLYDVYKDFNTVVKDFTIAVDNINNVAHSTEDAGSLYAKAEGAARSVLDSYQADLVSCEIREKEPLVTPEEVPPPAWESKPSAGGSSTTVAVRTSFDPNDKTATAGVGTAGFIQDQMLAYKIEFENDPNLGATIPAQEVFVTDVLDADLDLSTVEFTGFGFNNFVFAVPAGLSRYETTIDLRPEGIDLLVPVIMDVNQVTRVLSVTFRSLDPLTGQLPDDVDAGFLPVNNKTLHNGEGFFTYTVRAKANSPSGTEIVNQANIVFDVNAPILTPSTRHTLDIGAPASNVTSLPTRQNAIFDLKWTGADESGGSGIVTYDVFVSDNGGEFTLFKEGLASTSATFTGQPGHTYRFYTVATDNVNHAEAIPLVADATTQISTLLWHNVVNSLDVTGAGDKADGIVVPGDALAIINYINAFGSGPVPANAPLGGPYYDTAGGPDGTGDNNVVPADALAVINFINAFDSGLPGPSGEGESAFPVDVFFSDLGAAGDAGDASSTTPTAADCDPDNLFSEWDFSAGLPRSKRRVHG